MRNNRLTILCPKNAISTIVWSISIRVLIPCPSRLSSSIRCPWSIEREGKNDKGRAKINDVCFKWAGIYSRFYCIGAYSVWFGASGASGASGKSCRWLPPILRSNSIFPPKSMVIKIISFLEIFYSDYFSSTVYAVITQYSEIFLSLFTHLVTMVTENRMLKITFTCQIQWRNPLSQKTGVRTAELWIQVFCCFFPTLPSSATVLIAQITWNFYSIPEISYHCLS